MLDTHNLLIELSKVQFPELSNGLNNIELELKDGSWLDFNVTAIINEGSINYDWSSLNILSDSYTSIEVYLDGLDQFYTDKNGDEYVLNSAEIDLINDFLYKKYSN